MKPEISILRNITARGRMAYALACVEQLASKLDYSSPKFQEMLGSLWEFTETKSFAEWNRHLYSPDWENLATFVSWLPDRAKHTKPSLDFKPLSGAPEILLGMLGLCAGIGEAHLYGAFQSTDSEWHLEMILEILEEQGIQPPSLERYKQNCLDTSSDPDGVGFPAPRSFYLK